MGRESTQIEPKTDLQVLGEIDLLSGAVNDVIDLTKNLEGRLKKVMNSDLGEVSDGKEPTMSELCSVATDIRAIRIRVKILGNVINQMIHQLEL